MTVCPGRYRLLEHLTSLRTAPDWPTVRTIVCDRFAVWTIRTERFTRTEIVRTANVAGRGSRSVSVVEAFETNARAGDRGRPRAGGRVNSPPRRPLPEREKSDASGPEKRRRESVRTAGKHPLRRSDRLSRRGEHPRRSRGGASRRRRHREQASESAPTHLPALYGQPRYRSISPEPSRL